VPGKLRDFKKKRQAYKVEPGTNPIFPAEAGITMARKGNPHPMRA